jgi:acetyltransferase
MASFQTERIHGAASPLSTPAAEGSWSAHLVTDGGLHFHVRPARPADEADLAAYFRSLPPENFRHRLLIGLCEARPERVQAVAGNDDPDTINFLAIDERSRKIIATAALAATKDRSKAELVLTTPAEWTGEGIGWTLLGHLVRYAEAAGIGTITMIDTSRDGHAVQLEREQGFALQPCPERADRP